MLAIKTLSPKAIIFRRSIRLMGNQFEISVVGKNPNWADERIDDAIAEINRVDKLISSFSDDNSVNAINRNAGIKAVKVDPEVFKLISRSIEISTLTHGVFDITYAVDNNLTDFDGGTTKLAVKTSVSYKNIVIDAQAQTVFLHEEGMRIGFAANGKGYAADRAKYILQMNGVSNGIINAGGDILAWGLQPDNEPWTVGSADPDQRSQPFANVEISNMAFATSLNTGKTTANINKDRGTANKKGFQVSGIKSVSIISPSAELADAMTTPVTSIGINTGLYMINQLNQIACFIIDDQDRVYTSKDVTGIN